MVQRTWARGAGPSEPRGREGGHLPSYSIVFPEYPWRPPTPKLIPPRGIHLSGRTPRERVWGIWGQGEEALKKAV